jgi:flagellar motility protein MotE (MotC chaperone)
MKAFRDIRVIPVVVVAVLGLAVLKLAGLLIDGGYVFDYAPSEIRKGAREVVVRDAQRETPQRESWAGSAFNFPANRPSDGDITGSVPDKKKEEPKPEVKAPDTAPPQPNAFSDPAPISPSERAVLERLQSRRQELEARAREIDIRESLLKTAEKRIESKAEDLKSAESRLGTATEQKAEAENARFKGIVTMYEGMKPKDAAKVFDRLDMTVLIEIASQIAPRKMSDILGLMSPEAAERLTVELARRAGGVKSANTSGDLPKIEGKPLTPRN